MPVRSARERPCQKRLWRAPVLIPSAATEGHSHWLDSETRMQPLRSSIGNDRQPPFLCWDSPSRRQMAGGGADVISPRVDGVINRYKDPKHFVCETRGYCFAYRREQCQFDLPILGDPNEYPCSLAVFLQFRPVLLHSLRAALLAFPRVLHREPTLRLCGTVFQSWRRPLPNPAVQEV